MSTTNSEICEQVVKSWNDRDLEAITALTDREAEYVNAPVAVEPGTRHGHEEIAEVFRKQWEGLTAEASLVIDRLYCDGAEVISVGRVSLQLEGSKAAMANRLALRWSFRNGLIIRLEVLGAGSGFDEAVRAVGIDPRAK